MGSLSPGSPGKEPDMKRDMQNKPWWFVHGMLVEDDYDRLYTIVEENNEFFFADNTDRWPADPEFQIVSPRSGPFDMVPSWAEWIRFEEDGSGTFHSVDKYTLVDYNMKFPVWPKCPQKFKPGYFPVHEIKKY